MGPLFTNLFAPCCTSPSFVFGAMFATLRMAFGPTCHLMCWLLSCGLCYSAVLSDGWRVILGEFSGRCTQCNNLALAIQVEVPDSPSALDEEGQVRTMTNHASTMCGKMNAAFITKGGLVFHRYTFLMYSALFSSVNVAKRFSCMPTIGGPPHRSVPGSCSHGAGTQWLLRSSSLRLLRSSSPHAGTQFAGMEMEHLTYLPLGHYLCHKVFCAFEGEISQ